MILVIFGDPFMVLFLSFELFENVFGMKMGDFGEVYLVKFIHLRYPYVIFGGSFFLSIRGCYSRLFAVETFPKYSDDFERYNVNLSKKLSVNFETFTYI